MRIALQRARHRLVGRRRGEQVDVAWCRDRVRDRRPVALDEVEVEPHPDEGREDVGEDDRSVDAEGVDGHEGHLSRELRRPDELEHRVLLAKGPVLGHVPPRLTEQPYGSPVGREPAVRAQDERGRLGV